MVLWLLDTIRIWVWSEKGIPCGTRVPALSTDKVTASLPGDAVAATGTVGVGSLSATVSPPAVVAAVVGTSGGRSAGTCSQCTERASSKVGNRSSQSTGSRNSGGEDGCERDHFEDMSWKLVA